MPLNDLQIRRIKPADKPFRLFDAGGLYLEIAPTGGKLWRLKYRYTGKEKRLSFGSYPVVSLADARNRRDEAKKLLTNNVDPGEIKKAQKTARLGSAVNSFEVITLEWFAKQQPTWSKSHADKTMARFKNDLFPWIGGRPIVDIKAPELLSCLRRIEGRGALDTAHRALESTGQVFRYAIATGRTDSDISAALRGALPPAKHGHFAAVTEVNQVGNLLRTMGNIRATFPVKCAMNLAPYLFVRPGELRAMRWVDIDFDRAEWCYVVSKTKTDHIVSLAVQSINILSELHPLTGHGEYVFPGARSNGRPMSDATINVALRRGGINTRKQQTGHGFRAMARTLLHQELNFAPEVIEHQLAHCVPDALGAAYNRTKFIEQRKKMMQVWADYLDRLRDDVESA